MTRFGRGVRLPFSPHPNRFSRNADRAASAKNPDRFFATLLIAATSPSSSVILIRIDLPGSSARTNMRAASSMSGSYGIASSGEGAANVSPYQ